MDDSARDELDEYLSSLGTKVDSGSFTLSREKIAERFLPILKLRPQVLMAAILRVLDGLHPAHFYVTRSTDGLSLEASGSDLKMTLSKPFANDGTSEEVGSAQEAWSFLVLLLSSMELKSLQVSFDAKDGSWIWAGGDSLVADRPGTGKPGFEWKLQLVGPLCKHPGILSYLEIAAPFLNFSSAIDGRALGRLDPFLDPQRLNDNWDLGYRVSLKQPMGTSLSSIPSRILRQADGRLGFSQAANPEVAFLEHSKSFQGSAPLFIRLAPMAGEVKLRFLAHGVLTDPISLPTRSRAVGEAIVKKDLKTDFTGLKILADEVDPDFKQAVAVEVDSLWASLLEIQAVGKSRSSWGRGCFRYFATLFVALATWSTITMLYSMPEFRYLTSGVHDLLCGLMLVAAIGVPWATGSALSKKKGGTELYWDPYRWVAQKMDVLASTPWVSSTQAAGKSGLDKPTMVKGQ